MTLGSSSGGSSLLGFLVATVVFSVSFATIVQVSVDREHETPKATQSNYEALASSLADLLLSSPGQGWYANGACQGSVLATDHLVPESVAQLGLGEERCAILGGSFAAVNNLSFDKLENLYRANASKDSNNARVDYQEARHSLQLDESRLDFHLRSWPLLADANRALSDGYRDPAMRLLYIGDYQEQGSGGQTSYLVQHQAGVVNGTDTATLYVNLTNNGTAATAFSVTFKVNTKNEIVTEHHTRTLDVDESQNVTFVVNKTSDWKWANNGGEQYTYTLRDPSKSVGNGSVSMSGLQMDAPSGARKIHIVESQKLQYNRSGGPVDVAIDYDALDGDGGGNPTYNGWSLEILNETDGVVASQSTLDTHGGTETFTMNSTGTFRSVLKGNGGWVAQTDWFNVVDADLSRFTPGAQPGDWIPENSTLRESKYAESLVEKFVRAVRDPSFDHALLPYAANGSVLPDDNRALAEALPKLLRNETGNGTTRNYTTVVVGSNVDHNGLTSGSVKYAIRDWVLSGGTLVVLGSDDQAVQWLQPIFHVGIQTGSGGLSVPDDSHPVLRTPNRLDANSLDPHGTVWHFNQEDDRNLFTHVVLSGSDDIVAVSNPGAVGDGRVLLTTWQPHDPLSGDPPVECEVATLSGACPGLQLFQNFITISYRTLYLDYGPRIREDAHQGAQTRIATVFHPELGRLVELYFLVYVFDS